MNNTGIDTDKDSAGCLDKILHDIERSVVEMLARHGIALRNHKPGTLVSYTRVRNAAIRQDYHEMRKRKTKKEYAIEVLADRYYLSTETIRHMINHKCL